MEPHPFAGRSWSVETESWSDREDNPSGCSCNGWMIAERARAVALKYGVRISKLGYEIVTPE